MHIQLLPFSRHFIKNFYFKLQQVSCFQSNSIFIGIKGVRVFWSESPPEINFSPKPLLIGIYENKNVYGFNFLENIDNTFNLMSYNIEEPKRSIAGIVKSCLLWHNENIFCGKCGKELIFYQKEPAKICSFCNNIIYPRLNPAIIVVIKKSNSLLLTRKKEWPSNRYGLVAGFIEYGETAEEAVQREVFEETGLKITNITFISSQFWPFPYQLMLGFKADYLEGEINIAKDELEEARWFHIDNLPELPPKSSIARYLIEINI